MMNVLPKCFQMNLQVSENTTVKKRVANAKPYGKWLQDGGRALQAVNFVNSTLLDSESLLKRQQYVSLLVN